MPFTPFHFGVHACSALPFIKRINPAVFILSNVVVDIEPLLVMIFNFRYPLHGYAHTLIGAFILGAIWGLTAFRFRKIFELILKPMGIVNIYTLKQYLISGISGALLHVLFDAPLYTDIRPFYPLQNNPLYGLISDTMMYKLCTLFFLPAIVFYIYLFWKSRKLD